MAISSYSLKKAPLKAVHLQWRCMRLPSCHFSSIYCRCVSKWFADDATGCDDFTKLRQCSMSSSKYGYFPKPSKCILLAPYRDCSESVSRAQVLTFRPSKDSG